MNQNQNQDQPKVVSIPNVQTTPQVVPQVVNANSSENKMPPVQTVVEQKKKSSKKNNVFVIILMLLLFAFVFFLPNITGFITKLKNESNNQTSTNSSLKSGKMRCYITKKMSDVDYLLDHVFTYEKNKLKTERIVTTHQLNQTSSNVSILLEKQALCESLESTLGKFNGMNAFCLLNETAQETTQEIDYRVLNLREINNNIAEFEGFYPSFKLDQSITEIKRNMEQSGYTCTESEK